MPTSFLKTFKIRNEGQPGEASLRFDDMPGEEFIQVAVQGVKTDGSVVTRLLVTKQPHPGAARIREDEQPEIEVQADESVAVELSVRAVVLS